jgi:hypothetical protein
MRKSTIFISAVLTTFALVMLYRIASAYTDNQTATEAAAEPTATPAPVATDPPAPTEVPLGPEEAAQRAAEVVGKTNLLSAESSTFNGQDAWLITFTNQDVVYVGLDGQILGVQVAPVVVNVAPTKQKRKNKDGNQGAVSAPAPAQSSGEHHDDDDDDHDDD